MSVAAPLTEAQIQEETRWITEMYAEVDRLSLSVFDKFFGDEITVNFGGMPTITKKEEVLKQFRNLFGGLEKLEHIFDRVYAVNGQVMVSTLIKYHFRGGAETEVTAFTVCHKAPGAPKATRVDIYGDYNVVFKVLGEVYAAKAKAGL